MRIPDLNVLVHAKNLDAPQHEVARSWLDDALTGTRQVGFAWIVVLGFLRLVTNPAIVASPMTSEAALDQLESWLAQPSAVLIDPARGHLTRVREALAGAGSAAGLGNDAHLAALAIERGATFASFDADFHRFEGLSFEFLR